MKRILIFLLCLIAIDALAQRRGFGGLRGNPFFTQTSASGVETSYDVTFNGTATFTGTVSFSAAVEISGTSLTLAADGDTIGFDPGTNLEIFRIEVDDKYIVTVDTATFGTLRLFNISDNTNVLKMDVNGSGDLRFYPSGGDFNVIDSDDFNQNMGFRVYNNNDIGVQMVGSGDGWINAGNIGFGTESPQHLLSLYNASPIVVWTDTDVNTTTSSAAEAIDTASVAIDASDATAPTITVKDVDGNTHFSLPNTGILTLPEVYGHDMNGETIRALQVNDSGELGYDSSTKRAKLNIRNIENTDWIYRLRPVRFASRNTGIERDGLIAEEVSKVNPEYAFYDKIEGEKVEAGVHYGRLIIPLLAEIQKLKTRIDELEKKLK